MLRMPWLMLVTPAYELPALRSIRPMPALVSAVPAPEIEPGIALAPDPVAYSQASAGSDRPATFSALPAPAKPTTPVVTVIVVVSSAPVTTTPGSINRPATVLEPVTSGGPPDCRTLTSAVLVPSGTSARLVT